MRSSTRTKTGSRTRWLRAGALSVAAVLAFGACSDDDSDGAGDGTTSSSAAVTRSVAAFCEAYVDANNATASGEGDPTPALDAARASAPEDILDEVEALIDAAAENEEQDAPSAEFFEANVAVGEYVEENCDFEMVEVTARDYQFEGLPDEIAAETVLVKFVNEGEEAHELAMFTVKTGEDRSLEELLALPEDQVETVATPVEGSAFALPGGTYYTTFDLVPGRTAAVCFIPVGLTAAALESGQEPQGAPHFTEGMADEFEVTA
jgi:hypothetical protein